MEPLNTPEKDLRENVLPNLLILQTRNLNTRDEYFKI